METEEIVRRLKLAQSAVDELFKEIGPYGNGDWGIINEGLIKLRSVITALDN